MTCMGMGWLINDDLQGMKWLINDDLQGMGWLINDDLQGIGWLINDDWQGMGWLINDDSQGIGWLINDDSQRMWKEVFFFRFHILSRHLPGGNDRHYRKPYKNSGCPSWRFDPVNAWVQMIWSCKFLSTDEWVTAWAILLSDMAGVFDIWDHDYLVSIIYRVYGLHRSPHVATWRLTMS